MSALDGWRLNPQFIDLSYYSLFVKICRITAHVKRFIENCRRKNEKIEMNIGPLEFKKLRKQNSKSAQIEAFLADNCNLTDGKPVE